MGEDLTEAQSRADDDAARCGVPVFRQRRLASLLSGNISGSDLGAADARKYEAEMKILVNRERVDAVVTPDPDMRMGAERLPQ